MNAHVDQPFGTNWRSLPDLIELNDPGIALVRAWASEAGANNHVIQSPEPDIRADALERLQVTTKSLLGAVVFETGGLLIDHGRLRIFGSGTSRSFWQVNDAVVPRNLAADNALLLIADDIDGGVSRSMAAAFGAIEPGQVYHLPSDGTKWMPLEVGYSDFIHWALIGDLSLVFDDAEETDACDASAVPFDQTYVFYPPLWTKEGGRAFSARRLIDANEHLRFRVETLGFEVD